jgi:hypothetical protein
MQKPQAQKSARQWAAMLATGLMLFSSSMGYAFTSQSVVTRSATAQLTGTGSVSMTVTVRRMSDNAAATDVAWTGVTLPTGWKNADHYIQLDHSITSATGGIRIVTNNKGAGASPTYTGSDTTAGGLVDNTDPSKILPVAWTIKDTVVGSTGPVSAKPYETTDGAGTTPQFQWLYMTDVANTALAEGAAYRTAVNSVGIHFGGLDTEFGAAASPNYVYLESNFTSAVTPRTYSTNRLIVEAYTE